MREFFRGWKRKVGALMLVMALVFMGGWMRSVSIFEEFSLRITTKSQLFIESGDGVFSFGRAIANDSNFYAEKPNWIRYRSHQHIREGWETFRWYWRFSDFGFGIHSNLTPHINELLMVVVPYWSITITLTLISLWLLLSKPQKSNQKKTARPVFDEGGATL